MIRKHDVSPDSRFLSLLGVPEKFQVPDVDNVCFFSISSTKIPAFMLTDTQQENFLTEFLGKLKAEKRITSKILIMSKPTDDSAMSLAFRIFIEARRYRYSCKAFNLGMFNKEEFKSISEDYDLIVLYTLSAESTSWKIDLCKDILKLADSCSVIVVAGTSLGENNSYSCVDFNFKFLNYNFNGYIEVEDKKYAGLIG